MSSRSELVGALEALVRLIDNADDLDAVRAGSILHNARQVVESARKGNASPLPWTPFRRVDFHPPTRAQIADTLRIAPAGWTAADVVAEFDRMRREEELWVNSRYQVNKRDLGDGGVHLSIKRIDQDVARDWRDFLRIKDQLVGEECELVELYPAHSRLVDAATQYHLWGSTDPTFRFGFGFHQRLVDGPNGGPSAQRAFEDTAMETKPDAGTE